jgi:hypothetical protein
MFYSSIKERDKKSTYFKNHGFNSAYQYIVFHFRGNFKS